jgi:feruloyl esterase
MVFSRRYPDRQCSNLQVNETELQRLTEIADATDPGQTNAINPNLKPYFDRGGKPLQYHGFADPLIP